MGTSTIFKDRYRASSRKTTGTGINFTRRARYLRTSARKAADWTGSLGKYIAVTGIIQDKLIRRIQLEGQQ